MKKFKSIGCKVPEKHYSSSHFVYCLVLCVFLFLTACGGDSASNDSVMATDDMISDSASVSSESAVSDSTPVTQEQGWVYVPEVITVEDEHADYEEMQSVGNAFCYVSLRGEDGNSARSICRYSLTDKKLTTVSIDWPEEGNNWDVGYRFFTQDQGLYMTANVYPADYSSMKRFLWRFDPEGKCLFARDITEQAGRDVSLCGLTVDSQGRIYLFLDNGEILLYTSDGDYHGTVSYGSPEDSVPVQIRGACNGADGRFYICVGWGNENILEGLDAGNVRCALMEIDFENARLTEAVGNLPNINGLCTGKQSDDPDSQYDLLLYDDRAVYGYSFSTQESGSGSAGEELFAWIDSDINGSCVTNLYLLEDGRMCATVVDSLNDDKVIVALERTKAAEAPQRENLVLVTVNGGSDLTTMAVKFNRGNNRYHLTVKSYESLTDLYNAILIKEPMDLIDLSNINVRRLVSQGLCEDLASYIDRSEVFDRSDFVDGILDTYTFDNTLAGIPSEFMLRTVVGDGALLNNKAGLTLEELLTLANRYPGAEAFDGVTKEDVLQYLLMFNEDAFIDWNTGVCHFDSEPFKAVLGYVNQFPDSMAGGSGVESMSNRVKNGEVLFAIVEPYPPVIFQGYEKIFGEDVACVGFPTADGKGGHMLFTSDAYAIATVSEHKEGAWSFIEESLTQEKGDLYAAFYITYPSLKKTLEERVETAMERGELTWDEVNVMLELLPDAMPCFSAEDDPVLQIINEEAGAYYSGQKSVDDVVSIIQNRVQLYLDENKS